jgi:hypothetical protein
MSSLLKRGMNSGAVSAQKTAVFDPDPEPDPDPLVRGADPDPSLFS